VLTSTLLVYQALDQFSNFSNHREELLVQQKEINQGAETIKNTIKVLDQRKDEAILRTFKGVSKHFMDVFKELVPRGTGCIQMHTESGEIEDAREEVRVSGRSVFWCIYFYRMAQDDIPENDDLEEELTEEQRSKVRDRVASFKGVQVKVGAVDSCTVYGRFT
jgi:hypothetical protein